MVHRFFEIVKTKRNMVDHYAMLATRSAPNHLKFSQLFPIFFTDNDGQDLYSANLSQYLDGISSDFRFRECRASKYMRWMVKQMFWKCNVRPPRDATNIWPFRFWLYLVWLLKHHINVCYQRNDNIFRFMDAFPVNEAKVVIVGNNPAKHLPSSGYAFHDSVCASTKQILEFAAQEMDLVSRHQGNLALQRSSEELSTSMQTCSLAGWIKQGVLLLNVNPTNVGNRFGSPSIWAPYAYFVIKHLNRKLDHAVFMFLGSAASSFQWWIDLERHLAIVLHHPSHYTYAPARPLTRTKNWGQMLPFLNANFYLFQLPQGETGNTMIDWNSITGTDSDGRNEERIAQLVRFFEQVRQASLQNPNPQCGPFSIVKGNGSEQLSLELLE